MTYGGLMVMKDDAWWIYGNEVCARMCQGVIVFKAMLRDIISKIFLPYNLAFQII